MPDTKPRWTMSDVERLTADLEEARSEALRFRAALRQVLPVLAEFEQVKPDMDGYASVSVATLDQHVIDQIRTDARFVANEVGSDIDHQD
jgi:hypothetical protein